jgi:type I site-specific restriction-modification system R (restriction) subunit
MARTTINNEDTLVQETIAGHLESVLGWESVYAYNTETFGPDGTLGRSDKREVVLTRDLLAALVRLNPSLPVKALDEALGKLTRHDFSRSLLQHNQEFYSYIRDGVPVDYKDEAGKNRTGKARVIDFDHPENNRFLAVRELWISGLRSPGYNRRADLVCFVNGLPLVFIELKAVHRNIRAGFDGNLADYMDESVIGHAFHHNAFLIVSNGHRARYGSITSGWEHFAEWKRNDERDKGSLEAQVLLDGMLAKDRLLDIVENFILFDASKAGSTRKVVGRNHQVLGVNLAVDATRNQEALKLLYPERKAVSYRQGLRTIPPSSSRLGEVSSDDLALVSDNRIPASETPLVQRAHPDLGRLGVFWQTQGSGKSYSMAFFTEKVRRKVPGNFTFVIMTDREDLDDQIYRTYGGCGVINPKTTPRAGSGKELRTLLQASHSYVFTLVQKFNQDVEPEEPYSTRDDIIVISDEAHRSQAGKFARKMRLALPNASFLGFTGTPLFKHDHLTKRIFGTYISRYDFKRSVEESLSTLYIDKPMKAHTLMQAIARANRRCEGKDFGLIVDYNGMLRSLREALAQYALGDDNTGDDEIVAPIGERVDALESAILETEAYLAKLGFDVSRLSGAKGFTKIQALADAVDAVLTSQETKARFEIMTRQVFLRFKALLMEDSAQPFAERHDNLEAIYKKLIEKRDLSDVTAVLKDLHRIVNEAIRTQAPGGDQEEAKHYDLSTIDMERLRDEFAKRIKHKATAIEDIRTIVERKLEQMMARNPERMDFYRKYSEIVADYNLEKDRVTIEETFSRLVDLLAGLNEEERRAVEEGLSQDELAIFDLLKKENLSKPQRESVKRASKQLLESVLAVIAARQDWTAKEPTKAEVEELILQEVFTLLPTPPFNEAEKVALAGRVYQHVWRQSHAGNFGNEAA